MRIEHLADHMEAIPILAKWVYEQWGHSFARLPLEGIAVRFEERAKRDGVPQVLVALEDDEIIGTASLIERDMSTRPELAPWLATVYVAPQWRQRGTGSELVRAVMREAAVLGLGKLYLFTPDKLAFYERLGWKALDHSEYRGERVTIMGCDPRLLQEA